MPLFKYSVLLLLLVFSWASFAPKTTVYASSFGYDPQDSTAVLQQAIDSMADCVIIDDPGVTGSVTVLNSECESRKLYIQSP